MTVGYSVILAFPKAVLYQKLYMSESRSTDFRMYLKKFKESKRDSFTVTKVNLISSFTSRTASLKLMVESQSTACLTKV